MSYLVQLETANGTLIGGPVNAANRSWTFTGLTPGTVYRAAVTAVNAGGASAAAASSRILLIQPTVTATAARSGNTVTWTVPRRSPDADTWTVTVMDATTGRKYTLTVQSGTARSVAITAADIPAGHAFTATVKGTYGDASGSTGSATS